MNRSAPNGCGPWWVSKKLKDTYFYEACTLHDIDYIDGNDRKKSDVEFYGRMKQIIRRDSKIGFIEKKARFSQAWFYYHIVRKLGWISHKKGLDI